MSDSYRTAPLRIEPSPPLSVKCNCPACSIPHINNHRFASWGDGPERPACTGPDGRRKVRKETWKIGFVLNLVLFFLILGIGLLGLPVNLVTASYWLKLLSLWIGFVFLYSGVGFLALLARERSQSIQD